MTIEVVQHLQWHAHAHDPAEFKGCITFWIGGSFFMVNYDVFATTLELSVDYTNADKGTVLLDKVGLDLDKDNPTIDTRDTRGLIATLVEGFIDGELAESLVMAVDGRE